MFHNPTEFFSNLWYFFSNLRYFFSIVTNPINSFQLVYQFTLLVQVLFHFYQSSHFHFYSYFPSFHQHLRNYYNQGGVFGAFGWEFLLILESECNYFL